MGLSLQGLKTFKELKDAKEKRAESAEKLLNPPIFLRGDRALAEMISLEPKAVNYTGTGTPVQSAGTMNQSVDLSPINTVGNLLPLDQDIAKYENDIKNLYLSNPLGQINDYKRRSAKSMALNLVNFWKLLLINKTIKSQVKSGLTTSESIIEALSSMNK